MMPLEAPAAKDESTAGAASSATMPAEPAIPGHVLHLELECYWREVRCRGFAHDRRFPDPSD